MIMGVSTSGIVFSTRLNHLIKTNEPDRAFTGDFRLTLIIAGALSVFAITTSLSL